MRGNAFKISGTLLSILACLTIGTGIGMAIQPQDTINNYDVYIIDDDSEYHCVEFYLENVNTSWSHYTKPTTPDTYYYTPFFNLSIERKTNLDLIWTFLETTNVYSHKIGFNLSIDGISNIGDKEFGFGTGWKIWDFWLYDGMLLPNGTNYEIQFFVSTQSTVPFNLTVILGYTVE